MGKQDETNTLRYHVIQPIERGEALRAFGGTDDNAIAQALLSLAYHNPDRRWVEQQCFHFARHKSVAIRGVAALCLGHLARIHRALDLDTAVPILRELAQEPTLAGRIGGVWDDIEIFIPESRSRGMRL